MELSRPGTSSSNSSASSQSSEKTAPMSNASSFSKVTFAPSPEKRTKMPDRDWSSGDGDDVASLRVALSAEKAVRKRKEKNLIKLAQELSLRATTIENQKKDIDGLMSSAVRLEAQVEAAKKELQEASDRHQKEAREHHYEITSMQARQRKLVRTHDDRIVEMVAKHDRQSEELRRDILQTRLDTDRLRARIASTEMKGNSTTADRRTLSVSRVSQKTDVNIITLYRIAAALVTLLVVPLVVFGSADGMCAPCSSGTTLTEGDSFVVEAPWWVPTLAKKTVFAALCAGRPRTRLGWDGSKLVIENLDVRTKKDNKPKVLLEKKVITAAKVEANNIVDGKGKEVKAPWTF